MPVCHHGLMEDGEYRPHISEVDGIYRCSICHKIDMSGKYELLEEFFLGKFIHTPEQFLNNNNNIPDDIVEKIIDNKKSRN